MIRGIARLSFTKTDLSKRQIDLTLSMNPGKGHSQGTLDVTYGINTCIYRKVGSNKALSLASDGLV